MDNKFGKTSKLDITTGRVNGKTVLENCFFSAPLKIMDPFYLAGNIMQVMQMSASAGLMAGDVQEISIKAKEGSLLDFTSQSYEKIHKMEEGEASRKTDIVVEKSTFVNYNPLPLIPFGGSAFRSKTKVMLADESSEFIMRDIISCGRAAREERFQYRYYRSITDIYLGNQLIYRDNTNFIPDAMDMEGFGLFEGYTHLANMVICNFKLKDDFIQNARISLADRTGISGGITRLESGDILIKIFGNNAQSLERTCNSFIF